MTPEETFNNLKSIPIELRHCRNCINIEVRQEIPKCSLCQEAAENFHIDRPGAQLGHLWAQSPGTKWKHNDA